MTSAERQREKDRSRVKLNCIECGKEYDISYAYFRQKKSKNDLCKSCMSKYMSSFRKERYNNLSDEEKKNYIKGIDNYYNKLDDKGKEEWSKQSSKHSKETWANLSQEEKSKRGKKISEARKNYWKRLSQEEKKAYAQIRVDWYKNAPIEKKQEMINKQKQSWVLDKEAKEKRLKPLRDGHRKWWDNLSEDGRNQHIKRWTDGQRIWYENLPQEEKDRRIIILLNAFREWWDNLDEEGKNTHYENSSKFWKSLTDEEKMLWSQVRKDMWNNKSDEEKLLHAQKISQKNKQKNSNLSQEEFEKRFKNIILGKIANAEYTYTESTFANILSSNCIKFQFQYLNQIEHPDFKKLFPYHPITGGKVFPLHTWDFIIYTKDKSILVDIDGGIHGISVKSYNLVKNMDFYDSRRLYQTDGLDAYIVKCYNNIIDDNTIVENIKTKEEISFKQFISLLNSYNITSKEIKEYLKNK